MGIFVEVIKIGNEDKDFVYYNYLFSCLDSNTKKLKTVLGKLKIDKKNGDVHTLERAEEDNGLYAQRASWTLMQHWEKGEYPDKAYWSS